MLKRYALEDMTDLWSDESQLMFWRAVEVAVLRAKDTLGILPDNYGSRIADALNAKPVNVELAHEMDKKYGHDLIGYVVSDQEIIKVAGLDEAQLHKWMTSYDTEDPALILRLRRAVELINDALLGLETSLRAKAREHKWTMMIARTHGQWAQPSTFGHLLLVYAEQTLRSRQRLEHLLETDLAYAKLSGAVGNYGMISPDLELKALDLLGLEPAEAETQILQRDRHAMVLSVIAVAHGGLEQIARTFHVMMRSEIHELQEPRKPNQRGSSAMAHKKNPHITEQEYGLPRLTVGDALAAILNIATVDFRDISQSSVERHIFPRATSLLHYAIHKMIWVIDNLVVIPSRMERSLAATQGVWASQRINDALLNAGINYNDAYVYVQQACFRSVDEESPLRAILADDKLPDGRTADEVLGFEALNKCFDPKDMIKEGIEYIFRNEKETA